MRADVYVGRPHSRALHHPRAHGVTSGVLCSARCTPPSPTHPSTRPPVLTGDRNPDAHARFPIFPIFPIFLIHVLRFDAGVQPTAATIKTVHLKDEEVVDELLSGNFDIVLDHLSHVHLTHRPTSPLPRVVRYALSGTHAALGADLGLRICRCVRFGASGSRPWSPGSSSTAT